MAAFFLSLFSYILPILLFFYLAIEIYFRNKHHNLNKIATVLFTSMMVHMLGAFLVNYSPIQYAPILSLYLKYLPIFLLMGTLLHFTLRLTPRYNDISWVKLILICYTPVFPAILFVYPPAWLYVDVIQKGIWKYEQPSVWLMQIFEITAFYTVFCCIYIIVSGLIYVSKQAHMENNLKQMKIMLLAVFTGGAWSILSAFILEWAPQSESFRFPDLSSLGVVIFALFVRYAMVNYSFLPSIEEKYRILYTSSPLSILLLDQGGDIKEANPMALQLFGLTEKELKERNLLSFISSSEVSLEELRRKDHFEIITANGDRRYITSIVETIESEGEKLQYVTLLE
jgi:PAS domain S-box-containing protein